MPKINFKKLNMKLENENKYKRSISVIIGKELSSITKPCYFPKINRYQNEISKLTEYDMAYHINFKKALPKKIQKFGIINEKYTAQLLLMFMYYLQNKGSSDTAKLTNTLLAIKFYSSILHRMVPKYCDNDSWNVSLDRISPKHQFKVKNGIPSAITYTADAVYRRYERKLNKNDIDTHDIIRYVYELRHRLAQSTKSWAEAYYRAIESKNKNSDEEKEKEDVQVAIDKIAMSICTYGQISKTALNAASMKSGLKREYGASIVSEISSVENRNKIRFIMILISRLDKIKNMCKETKRNVVVRKTVSGVKIGKYKINNQILELIFSLESGTRYKSLKKEQLIIFLTHYITLFMKEKIC